MRAESSPKIIEGGIAADTQIERANIFRSDADCHVVAGVAAWCDRMHRLVANHKTLASIPPSPCPIIRSGRRAYSNVFPGSPAGIGSRRIRVLW